MKKTYFLISAASALALTSCTSYEEKPIDLVRETLAWTANSEATVQEHPEITLEDAQTLGLLLNPELNSARARLAKSEAVKKESGWWQDPAYGLSTKRNMSTSIQPWAYTSSLTFTIPVTGLPGLEEEISEHYAESDFWTLVQEEIDFRVELRTLWIEYAVATKKLEITEAYLEKIEQENRRLALLADAGEVSQDEMQGGKNRQTETEAKARDLHLLRLELRSRIARQIGLAPFIAHDCKIICETPTDIPAPVASPSPEDLAKLPKIRAGLASYAASETALKTEIRRQYPELQIGPSYEIDGNDSFEDQLSLSIGVTLPLWNRNRRNIAAAEGDREIARIETLTLWKDQFHTLRRLEREQDIAEHYCRDQQKRMLDLQTRLETIYKAIDIGELSPVVLNDAAQQAYSATLGFLDSLGDFHKARLRIQAMKVERKEDR